MDLDQAQQDLTQKTFEIHRAKNCYWACGRDVQKRCLFYHNAKATYKLSNLTKCAEQYADCPLYKKGEVNDETSHDEGKSGNAS